MTSDMTYAQFFDFISYVLYLYIAWMSGVILGYVIAKRE